MHEIQPGSGVINRDRDKLVESVFWNGNISVGALARSVLPSFPSLTPVAVIDIFLFAFLTYQFLMAIRGRRAARIFIGLLSILAMYAAVSLLGLELMRAAFSTIAPYTPF